MRKICVVTGTRAEYGLLKPLLNKIKADDKLQLQLVVTGMHLSPEFGLTYKQIEEDGFTIDEKVEMLLSSDTSVGVAKAMGLATISFADSFNRLKSDIVVILGDRFEMLAVAQTALIMQIPIAHIHGGEVTLGAYDDAIRHSITKMANWHFVSSNQHQRRVIQLGEQPSSVFNVGALGIENIKDLPLLTKQQIYKQLRIKEECPTFLVTYHPETTTENTMLGLKALCNGLRKYQNYNIVITKANADNGGREINKQLENYALTQDNVHFFDSLGQLNYLSLLQYVIAVIGNSSSGLIEAPYFNIPTVNIGERQLGRECPKSVIHCKLNEQSIEQAIKDALSYNDGYEYIFGEGDTSKQILTILKEEKLPTVKEFYDL